MPGKKLPKAEQDKADAQSAADAEAAAAEAAKLHQQQQIDSFFTPNPTVRVLHDDTAAFFPVLLHHFFPLYHPPPPPPAAVAVVVPPVAAEEEKETVVVKGKTSVKAKTAVKKQTAEAAAPPPPPPAAVSAPPPPARPADHPLSLLEAAWQQQAARYDALESEILSSAGTTAAMATEGLLDLSRLIAAVEERRRERSRAIVRCLPTVTKKPSTRGGQRAEQQQMEEKEQEEEERRRRRQRASKARLGRKAASALPAAHRERQQVQRELSKLSIGPIALADNQAVLQRMQRKQQFLLAPRHRERETAAAGDGLHCDASELRWERWVVGDVQERCVRLSNVSDVTQRVSVTLPPSSSPAFSLSSSSSSPAAGSSSLCSLAPGMAVTLRVTFTASSLQSASSFLSIASSLSSFSLPLYAHRIPCTLSLPSQLTMQATLLSRRSTRTVRVENRGLAAAFTVRLQGRGGGVFSLWPEEFELGPGQDILLTLTFAPTQDRTAAAERTQGTEAAAGGCEVWRWTDELTVTGEDGTVRKCELSGEAAALAVELRLPAQEKSQALLRPRAPFLFSIEQRNAAASSSSSSLLSFPSTSLGSSATVCFTLSNTSPVPLPFQFLLPFHDSFSSLTPVFHLYPQAGTLTPYQQRDVVATFTPRGREEYRHWMQLLINGEGEQEAGGGAADVSVAEVRLHGDGRLGRARLEQADEGSWSLAWGEWEQRRLLLVSESEDVELEYTVELRPQQPAGLRCQLWPLHGLVEAGGRVQLSLNVQVETESRGETETTRELQLEVEVVTWPGGERALLLVSGRVGDAAQQQQNE